MNSDPKEFFHLLPDEQVLAFLTWIRGANMRSVALACSFSFPAGELAELVKSGCVGALLSPYFFEADCIDASRKGPWDVQRWRWAPPDMMPDTLVFMGYKGCIGINMTRSLWRSGVRTVIWLGPSGWETISVLALIADNLWRIVLNHLPQVKFTALSWFRWSLTTAEAQRIESSPFSLLIHDLLGGGYRRRRRYTRSVRQLAKAGKWLFTPNPGKVVVCVGSLGPGGAERQVVMTLEALADDLVVRPTLMCDWLTRFPGGDFFLPKINSERVDVIELPESPRDSDLRDFASLARQAGIWWNNLPQRHGIWERVALYRSALLELRPQVVHVWMEPSSLFVGLAAVILGVPKVVLSTRSVAPYHFPIYQEFFRPLYQSLAEFPQVQLVNNSEAGARSYAKWLGLPRSQFAVIRNGLMGGEFLPPDRDAVIALRARIGLPEGSGPVIGGIFRLSEEKRPLLWVAAAVEVLRQEPNASFMIVGDGGMRSEIEQRARDVGIADRLFLVGNCEDVRVPLALFTLLLLTSRQEGLPNVLIEAQAQGVPVVSTRVGGVAETIEEGVTGYSVTMPVTALALADRIVAMLRDQAWMNRAKERAPRWVTEQFGRDRVRVETLALYGLAKIKGDSEP
jgi:glycosyltransferase involved in cell wall biosynthesis